jgi:hypothetical protein
MEYFDDYDEQLEKKLSKPETVKIPERYYETEAEDYRLTLEEQFIKKKRLQGLKKVLAAQSLQDFSLNDINKQAEISLQNNNNNKQQKTYFSNFISDNDSNDLHLKYEQEKREREQVIFSCFFFIKKLKILDFCNRY